MWKLDVPQILISVSAIFGISLLWYDFNVKVLDTVSDLRNCLSQGQRRGTGR